MVSTGQRLHCLTQDRPHQNDEYRGKNEQNHREQDLDRRLVRQRFRPGETLVAELVALDPEQLPDPDAQFIRLDDRIDHRSKFRLFPPRRVRLKRLS